MQATVVFAETDAPALEREALSTAVATLERAGHEVTVVDLWAERFDPVMTATQRRAYLTDHPVVSDDVAGYVEIIQRTELLVFVYATQLNTMPALMKGWLEKVMVPGVAFQFNSEGKLRPALTQVRHIIGISTYPEAWSTMRRQRDAGRRTITRALRLNTGWRTRHHWIGLYSCPTATREQRGAFLSRIEHRLEQV